MCLLPLLRDPDLRHTHTYTEQAHKSHEATQKHKKYVYQSIQENITTDDFFLPKKSGVDFVYMHKVHANLFHEERVHLFFFQTFAWQFLFSWQK